MLKKEECCGASPRGTVPFDSPSFLGVVLGRLGRLPQLIYFANSPVGSKRTPATAVPEASTLRIPSRFGPASAMAADRQRRASSPGVPSGKRKIQGMLVEVSARSEEMATTGTNDFTPICAARWLELRSSAITAS